MATRYCLSQPSQIKPKPSEKKHKRRYRVINTYQDEMTRSKQENAFDAADFFSLFSRDISIFWTKQIDKDIKTTSYWSFSPRSFLPFWPLTINNSHLVKNNMTLKKTIALINCTRWVCVVKWFAYILLLKQHLHDCISIKP